MQITKAKLQEFRADFAQAMKELEAKHEATIDLGNISFSESEFSTKLVVRDANAESKEAESFRAYEWKSRIHQRWESGAREDSPICAKRLREVV